MKILAWHWLVATALMVVGCDKPATKIGTSCKTNGDCNIAGQVCSGGICTHTCTGIVGQCPVGYDCFSVDGTQPMTCNRAPYAVDETGKPVLYGKPCAIDFAVCYGLPDPNPTVSCRHSEDPSKPGMPVESDPNAYCTGACNTDNDCPYFMYCGTDYDAQKKCLIRGLCDPCKFTDACNRGDLNNPIGYACVPTTDGSEGYCSKTCGSQNDCPGAAQELRFMSCGQGTDLQGNDGIFCFHKYGACVGKGEICDPCRTSADCTVGGTKCYPNIQTGERMCTKGCSSDTSCAGPNNATCDNTDPNSSTGACTGDPEHNSPGGFSCWGI